MGNPRGTPHPCLLGRVWDVAGCDPGHLALQVPGHPTSSAPRPLAPTIAPSLTPKSPGPLRAESLAAVPSSPAPPGEGRDTDTPQNPGGVTAPLSAAISVPPWGSPISVPLSVSLLGFPEQEMSGSQGRVPGDGRGGSSRDRTSPHLLPLDESRGGDKRGSSLMSLLILPLRILMRGRDLIRGQGALTSAPWSHPIPPPVPEPSAGPGETGAGGLGNRTGARDPDSWVLAEEMTCAPGLTEQGAEDPDS